MNRTMRGLAIAFVAGVLAAGTFVSGAQSQSLVCSLGQKVCGNRCYSPLKGESCNEGNVVCQVGQKVCGRRCYSPLRGETCNIRTK
ncbi:MAG: hypothetical protein AB7O88_13305 [Reyranellaceae bacterium]